MMNKLRNNLYRLLRWSEKYTKTDMVYLTKGGFWLFTSQVISSLVALFLSVAFSNLLSKESYGIYKYILSIAVIIGSLSVSGFFNTVIQSVAEGFEGILKKSFFINLKWSLIGSIVSLSISLYYLVHQNYAFTFCFLIIALFNPIYNSLQLYAPFLNGKKDFKNNTLLGLIPDSLVFLSLFLTILVTENPVFIILSYFASNTLGHGLAYLITIKIYHPNNKIKSSYDKFSFDLSLVNIIQICATQIDKIIIFQYLGAANLAIYFFATAIPEQLRGFVKIGNALLLPKIAEKTEQKTETTLKKEKMVVLLTLLLVVFYIVFAPFIFKLLFPQYLESIKYSQVYSIGLIAIALSMFYATNLQVKIKTKEIYLLNLISSVLNIILILVLFLCFKNSLWVIILARLIGFYSTAILGKFFVNR